jgi:hypothetical protein
VRPCNEGFLHVALDLSNRRCFCGAEKVQRDSAITPENWADYIVAGSDVRSAFGQLGFERPLISNQFIRVQPSIVGMGPRRDHDLVRLRARHERREARHYRDSVTNEAMVPCGQCCAEQC